MRTTALLPTAREIERQERLDAIAVFVADGIAFVGCIGAVGVLIVFLHIVAGA